MNLAFIPVTDANTEGSTKAREKEAEEFCNKLKENFKEAGINDGDTVAIIHIGGSARAIGCIGEDCWIDVKDKFAKKTFEELNIIITSLTVQ